MSATKVFFYGRISKICSNFHHQYFRRRWWPSSLLFALGLFRTGHWQRSFPTEPTRPDRPLVMINIFLGKCENTFFSLILPNFSTKNKSAKQPITAFFSSRINIFPRKSQNPKNGCCCFGGKKSLRQKIINVKLKILFFANLNFWWLAPGCTLPHFVSNLLLPPTETQNYLIRTRQLFLTIKISVRKYFSWKDKKKNWVFFSFCGRKSVTLTICTTNCMLEKHQNCAKYQFRFHVNCPLFLWTITSLKAIVVMLLR